MSERNRGSTPPPLSMSRWSRLGIIVSSLFVAAAASGAPPAKPAVSANPPASPPPADSAAAIPPLEPEQPFTGERLTFEEAVRRAIAKNPTVLTAVDEIARSEALVREVRSGSYPTLSANAQYTHLDSDRILNGTIVAAQNQLSANLTLLVPIVAAQQWVQWGHAKDALDVSKMTADDTRRQVALATARTYLAIISQERVIEVDRRAVGTAQAHYDFAHTRFAGGIGNRIDEVRARQQLLSNRAQLESAYAGVTRIREALGVLVGTSDGVGVSGEPALANPTSLSSALAEAETDRSDVRAADRRARAAERVARDSWVDYLPLLTGELQPLYQNPPTLTQPKTGWQVFLILSLPLYDGGARYGRTDERTALASEARLAVDATLRQAKSEVRVAFEAVRRADLGLTAAEGAASAAHEALDLATLAYRAGATTNLEVIDAERSALDADTAVTVAEDGARQARLDLLAASGRFP